MSKTVGGIEVYSGDEMDAAFGAACADAKVSAYPWQTDIGERYVLASGLTKRELFAAMAMQGRAAVPGQPHAAHDARVAVDYADALLAELEKTP